MRKWTQLFVAVFGALMFFTQCAEHARPYLRVILGEKKHAAHETPADRR